MKFKTFSLLFIHNSTYQDMARFLPCFANGCVVLSVLVRYYNITYLGGNRKEVTCCYALQLILSNWLLLKQN